MKKWVTMILTNYIPETRTKYKTCCEKTRQKNKKISKQFYEYNKKRLQKMNRDRHRGLPEEKE